jgi:hypothetical protein
MDIRAMRTAQPTFLSRVHDRDHALKHQQGVLDDVNVHVGKERTYDKQA